MVSRGFSTRSTSEAGWEKERVEKGGLPVSHLACMCTELPIIGASAATPKDFSIQRHTEHESKYQHAFKDEATLIHRRIRPALTTLTLDRYVRCVNKSRHGSGLCFFRTLQASRLEGQEVLQCGVMLIVEASTIQRPCRRYLVRDIWHFHRISGALESRKNLVSPSSHHTYQTPAQDLAVLERIGLRPLLYATRLSLGHYAA